MSTYLDLFRAIREHGGLSWRDIAEAGEHGADAGWSGFIYTGDGAEFYRNNRQDIDGLLLDGAMALGCDNVAEFMASFGRADMTNDGDSLDCLKAWFALEEVGRWIQDQRDHAPIYA